MSFAVDGESYIGEGVTGMGSNSVVIGNASINRVHFRMTTTGTNGTACGFDQASSPRQRLISMIG
jgi:hypothetical protein